MTEEPKEKESQLHDDPAVEENITPKQEMPKSMMVLGFLAMAGVGMLLVMMGRNSGPAAGKADHVQTGQSAEEKVLRDELNRRRAELGLRPMEGGGETVEEISRRMKRDADTMVSLAGSFQDLLAEKDAAISEAHRKLLSSEQLRQSLAAETQRLQLDLQKALVASSESEVLRGKIDALSAQRDALAKQTETLREQVASQSAVAGNAAELETLRKRAEEATRAREFFEKRVGELEAELAKP